MTPEEPIPKEAAATDAQSPDSEASAAAPDLRATEAEDAAENETNSKPQPEQTSQSPARNEDSAKPVAPQRVNPALRPAPKPAIPSSAPQSAVAPKPLTPPKPVAEKAPPPPFVPEPSLPVTMIVRPDQPTTAGSEEQRFPGELEEDFSDALARVKLTRAEGVSAVPFLGWTLGLLTRASRNSSSADNRRVAFDGFRSDLYDEKIERDRRYGTVYTVSEEVNAFLVRLELPRHVPRSSLRETWRLPDEMPDYRYTLSLVGNIMSIQAGLAAEVLRRVSYVSPSFPSDFLTRIEFQKPVEGFKHRLRDKVLEIIVFKQQSANPKAVA